VRNFVARRALASLIIALLSALGLATQANADSRLISLVDSSTPSATLIAWVPYEGPFQSYGSCQARAGMVMEAYGGTYQGAVAGTKCVLGYSQTCPPKFGIMLFVQYVTGVGGGDGWRIEPAIGEPAVTCAA
jgi:hypothetical protein